MFREAKIKNAFLDKLYMSEKIWNYLSLHEPPRLGWGGDWKVIANEEVSTPKSIALPLTLATRLPKYMNTIYAVKRGDIELIFFSRTSRDFSSFIEKVGRWLDFLQYNHYILVHGAKIYFYWTPWKKRFPTSCVVGGLGEAEVNTGFTSDKREVIIFRSEEALKVFIHETFHLFGLDIAFASDKLQRQGDECMKKIYGPTCIGNLYEIYTETWARIIYTFYSSDNLKQFTNLIQKQQNFSRHQARLVSNYRHDCQDHSNVESTSVFAYYEGTAQMLSRLDAFWEFCCHWNHPLVLKMLPKKEITHAFCNLVANTRLLSRTKKNSLIWNGKSLRMTAKRQTKRQA